MNEHAPTLLGLAAACCTTAAFVPQAVLAIRTRDTRSLSLGMYALFTVGVSLWLVYGLFLRDVPIVAANVVTLCFCLIILYLKIRNDGVPGTGKPGGKESVPGHSAGSK